MILDTDMGKHNHCISHFRKEFLHGSCSTNEHLTPHERKDLLSMVLKCCDVGHSTKPFQTHMSWTLRINVEFFEQGDAERRLGLPCQPLCDRSVAAVTDSQRGFYRFIVVPLFCAMDEYLGKRQLQLEVIQQMDENRNFWELYDGSSFNYTDPMANAKMLCALHHELTMKTVENRHKRLSVTDPHLRQGRDVIAARAKPRHSSVPVRR
mmetsp:Transcript_20950/g.48672  ORF Transcript_20950/g.48672 Transcript_20950/m.48672 type:complete len:208 (-) Transcript_20950:237-860(-)